MNNPFENEHVAYVVLMNDAGQYSLWPDFLDAPDGWVAVYGGESRQVCLDYINAQWVDMRPNYLKAGPGRKEQQNAGPA